MSATPDRCDHGVDVPPEDCVHASKIVSRLDQTLRIHNMPSVSICHVPGGQRICREKGDVATLNKLTTDFLRKHKGCQRYRCVPSNWQGPASWPYQQSFFPIHPNVDIKAYSANSPKDQPKNACDVPRWFGNHFKPQSGPNEFLDLFDSPAEFKGVPVFYGILGHRTGRKIASMKAAIKKSCRLFTPPAITLTRVLRDTTKWNIAIGTTVIKQDETQVDVWIKGRDWPDGGPQEGSWKPDTEWPSKETQNNYKIYRVQTAHRGYGKHREMHVIDMYPCPGPVKNSKKELIFQDDRYGKKCFAHIDRVYLREQLRGLRGSAAVDEQRMMAGLPPIGILSFD